MVDTSEYPIAKNGICSEEMPISSEEIPIYSEEMQPNILNNNNLQVSKKVSNKKGNLESYDEIFAAMQVSDRTKRALIDFIRHLKVNGIVMINKRLEDLIFKLDSVYGMNELAKCKEIRNAILNGYKRLPCEGD